MQLVQLFPLLPVRSIAPSILLTWRERLPQLLGLVGVLENEGVEVGLAADLELGLAGSAALLDARSCGKVGYQRLYIPTLPEHPQCAIQFLPSYSFHLLCTSERGKLRTGGILSAADLNEGLDVADFLRHDGRLVELFGGVSLVSFVVAGPGI